MFGVAAVVVALKALLAAALGNVGELQPLRVPRHDLPLVVQLHLLRVLDAWQHHEAGLRGTVVPASSVRVRQDVEGAHRRGDERGEGCHKQILIWLTVAAEKQ